MQQRFWLCGIDFHNYFTWDNYIHTLAYWQILVDGLFNMKVHVPQEASFKESFTSNAYTLCIFIYTILTTS